MASGAQTVAEAVLDVLDRHGVDIVFGCPGTTEVPLLDAWVGRVRPRFVLAAHEAAAVAMADGYARGGGGVGVALVHANVGLGNALANLYCAAECRVPLVVINGLKPTVLQARRGFTTSHDTRDLARQYAKWDWVSLQPDQVADDLERALKIACAAPAGVAYLGLYEDFAGAEMPVRTPRDLRVDARLPPDPALLGSVAGRLEAARRPLLLYGDDVAREGGFEAGVALAERLAAPVLVESRVSRGWQPFPTEHPLYHGGFRAGEPLLSTCDLLLAVGTRLFTEFSPPQAPQVPAGLPFCHIHSDPWELNREYHADVSVRADALSAIEGLLAALGPGAPWAQPRERVLPPAGGRLRPVDVVLALNAVMDERTTVMAEGVTSNEALADFGRFPGPLSYQANGAASCLSWGLGAAVGFRMAAPARRVLALVGDGVFLFSMQALWTAVRERVPVVAVVVNNRQYAAVKTGLLRFGGRSSRAGVFPGTDLAGVDCVRLAEGIGCRAARVADRADLLPAIRSALSWDEPVVIEVLTDPDDLGPLHVA